MAEFRKDDFGFLSPSESAINQSTDCIINRVITKIMFYKKRPVSLSKRTAGESFFQHKKETDFANLINLIKGNISGKRQGMIVIGNVKATN